MSRSDYVHLDFEEIVAESQKALLVRFEEGEQPLWIPLSQVADSDDYSVGDGPGTISLTAWICEQKELG
jgi:hypothetical protein